MAKELPYFRFTVAEWMNGDIQMVPKEVKGTFADIMAFYWFKDCSITLAKLKKRFINDTGDIKTLLEEEIIKHNHETDFVEIDFLDEQYSNLNNLHKTRVLAGQKGGLSKAKAKLKQKPSYKDKDKDKDKEKERDIKNKKKVKHRYGEYKNVLLTDVEKQKLKDKFGEKGAKEWVVELDEGIEQRGYKYNSHYITILKWDRDRKKKLEPNLGI